MNSYYLDTSALIKNYVAEVGSHWITNVVNSVQMSLLFTSRLTIVEVRSAFNRRQREASITQEHHTDALDAFTEDALTRYRFVEFDTVIVDLATELLDRHPLRAYDAVQLASALRISRVLVAASLSAPIFLTADDQLLAAAGSESLPADNPNLHP